MLKMCIGSSLVLAFNRVRGEHKLMNHSLLPKLHCVVCISLIVNYNLKGRLEKSSAWVSVLANSYSLAESKVARQHPILSVGT